MQIRYLDGDVVDILPMPESGGEVYRVVVNGELYCTTGSEYIDTVFDHLKQAKPWVRDNGDGTHTVEYPDEQVKREGAIHSAQNRCAGGWSGD